MGPPATLLSKEFVLLVEMLGLEPTTPAGKASSGRMLCDLRLPYPGRDRWCPPGDHRFPDATRTQHGPSAAAAFRGRGSARELAAGTDAEVDAGVAEPEAELLVEAVGRYPRGAGGQVDAASALLLRQVNRGHDQGCGDAVAAGVPVDNAMFDRIANSGRTLRQPGMLGWRSPRCRRPVAAVDRGQPAAQDAAGSTAS